MTQREFNHNHRTQWKIFLMGLVCIALTSCTRAPAPEPSIAEPVALTGTTVTYTAVGEEERILEHKAFYSGENQEYSIYSPDGDELLYIFAPDRFGEDVILYDKQRQLVGTGQIVSEGKLYGSVLFGYILTLELSEESNTN